MSSAEPPVALGGDNAVATERSDLARQIFVLVSSVLAIVAAFIGAGVVIGTPIQDAAGGALDSDSTLIAPGTGAFRIWSVIYTGMLAYAIWQALPAQRRDVRQRRLGWWVSASLVLTAAWIFSVQLDLLPLSLPIIVVITAVDVGALILTESILSFLGLGVQPPTPTWGNMLYRANDFVFLQDPVTKEYIGLHLLIWPGVLITLTVLSFYLIGDGLRDALDPMLKNKKLRREL